MQALQQVDARIQNLAANQLGAAFGQTIWIDSDAAGHGWRDGQSGSGVDLLSVVVHEMGHVLGLEHDVLGTYLAAGASDRSADLVFDDLDTHTADVDGPRWTTGRSIPESGMSVCQMLPALMHAPPSWHGLNVRKKTTSDRERLTRSLPTTMANSEF